MPRPSPIPHLLVPLLAGCLVNTGLYEERLDDLIEANSPVDADGDGFALVQDCDDGDPRVHPQADEVCDGVDNDCDGTPDDGIGEIWYLDDDEDGQGDADFPLQRCDQPDGYVGNASDCDDADDEVYVGATEGCDGKDNDCNDVIDDASTSLFFLDEDGDGYGTDAVSTERSCPPEGYVDNDVDCEDGDPTIHPGELERCDEGALIDEDCDGLVDDADPDTDISTMVAYYDDEDGDGFGAISTVGHACVVPQDAVLFDNDCDDTDPRVGAPMLWRFDSDGDGYGGELEEPLSCDPPGPDWWAEDSLFDCDDTDAYRFPGAAEICDDGVDQNCDDLDSRCHVPLPELDNLAEAEAVLRGTEALMSVGVALSAAGDQDLDGRPDVLIGASGADGAAADAGAVYVLSGPVYGTFSLDDVGHARIVGEAAGDQLGRGVAGLGDTSEDGVADVMVGAPFHDSGIEDRGAVYLLLGPLEGEVSLDEAAAVVLGDRVGDGLGDELVSAGDVDGDGLADLLIGAEKADIGALDDAGAAYLFLSPLTGPRVASDADAVLYGGFTADLAGTAIIGTDLDSDGLSDLVVSAPQADTFAPGAGELYLLYAPIAPDVPLALSADATFTGEGAGDKAGNGMCTGGDANSDGVPDLLVGARFEDSVADDGGAAYLIAGGIYTSVQTIDAAVAKFTASAPDEKLGRSMAITDVDGDGEGDVVISVDESDVMGRDSGSVYIFPGPIAPGVYGIASASAKLHGTTAGDQAGYGLAAVGDMDLDGYEDLAIGAYNASPGETHAGEVYLVYGTDL